MRKSIQQMVSEEVARYMSPAEPVSPIKKDGIDGIITTLNSIKLRLAVHYADARVKRIQDEIDECINKLNKMVYGEER